MTGSREGYLTEVYKIIRDIWKLDRNQLFMISFNKGTKKKKIKKGQQEPDSKQTNLCNFLPKDTVNIKSLQWFK